MFSRDARISKFNSAPFSFSANAYTDDSAKHTIFITMSSNDAWTSRESSAHPSSAFEALQIILGAVQIIAFVTFYVLGVIVGLLFEVYRPCTVDSSVDKVSSASESAISCSSIPVPSSAEEQRSPSPVISTPSSPISPSLVSSASALDILVSCLDGPEPRPETNISCSGDISPEMLEADIGPHNHIDALLFDARKENTDLSKQLQEARDALDAAWAKIDEIIDERNELADAANAKISEIVAERDELIEDLKAFVTAKAVLTDDLLASSYSLASTDDSHMSLSSESDFNSLVFEVSLDSPLADTIAACCQSLPRRPL